MTAAQFGRIVLSNFKNKKFLIWISVRVVSAFGPLLATYIFARGIRYIENGESFDAIIRIFLILLIVEIVEHLLRLLSKTRTSLYSESILMKIQQDLVIEIKPISKIRKYTIQSIRNLTQSIRGFVIYLYENGIPGLVSFAATPIILFLIDRRIFVIQLILYFIYFLITYFFSLRYEKSFEGFDASRESYYTKIMTSNKIGRQAGFVAKKFKQVEDVTLVEWLTLQNLISVVNFIVVAVLVGDIINGQGQISGLILVVGYTKESKKFLNEITTIVNNFMRVRAGIERLTVTSNGKIRSIV
jgi:hypothetical protein